MHDDFRSEQKEVEEVIGKWTRNRLRAAVKRSRLAIQITASKKRKVFLTELQADVRRVEEENNERENSEYSGSEEDKEANYDIDTAPRDGRQVIDSNPTHSNLTPDRNKSLANDSGIALISPVTGHDTKQAIKADKPEF